MLAEIYETITQAQIARQQGKKAGIPFQNGWTFSLEFHHFQKTKNNIYVYITPQMFGRWVVQGYPRRTTGICSLEARVHDPMEVEKLFELGEKWLQTYQDSLEDIPHDPYHPFNRDGWRGEDITKEALLY